MCISVRAYAHSTSMMGKIYSMLTRPIRTFNIANRAEKIISREKPVPAPQYASTEKLKKLSHEANPSFLENHYRKDMQLDQRLKDVFVTSTDSQEIITSAKESKLLPQSRHTSEEFDYFHESTIPLGKCSLKQVFTFLSGHKRDPATYSSEYIAAQYKLDKEVVDNILKHYKLYVNITQNTSEQIGIVEDNMQELFDKALENKKRTDLLKEK
ncbi:protein NDUFAF4 homolog isoform X2 [Linepithema humile]|uniref:protein NDUFAF4 homolog isoform X2 n=1 Tax=Linepithema humile TaxID=83485 RepID=UPI00351DDF71